MFPLLLQTAEVWHLLTYQTAKSARMLLNDKTLKKAFINESKSAKTTDFKDTGIFTENVTAVKSWIRLVPTYITRISKIISKQQQSVHKQINKI